MKAVWGVVSALAVANVLALAGFAGLLWMTDRLDGDRVERVRAMLATTIEQERAAEEARAQEERERAEEAEREATMAIPPDAAAMVVHRRQTEERVEAQHLLRLRAQVQSLLRTLEREQARIEAERSAILAEREAFERFRRRLEEIDGAEQFRKSVVTLEQQRPRDAREILRALLDQGEVDQVVAYLNAMEERARSKVVAEFAREESDVAADLLERLRTRGVVLRDPEDVR